MDEQREKLKASEAQANAEMRELEAWLRDEYARIRGLKKGYASWQAGYIRIRARYNARRFDILDREVDRAIAITRD